MTFPAQYTGGNRCVEQRAQFQRLIGRHVAEQGGRKEANAGVGERLLTIGCDDPFTAQREVTAAVVRRVIDQQQMRPSRGAGMTDKGREIDVTEHIAIDHQKRISTQLRQRPGNTAIRLTPREEEILGMISEGLSYRDIADRACISYKTVSNVSLVLKDKLGASNLADLVVRGIRYFEGE